RSPSGSWSRSPRRSPSPNRSRSRNPNPNPSRSPGRSRRRRSRRPPADRARRRRRRSLSCEDSIVEHLHHFGLSEDPFRNDHLERFLHDSPAQADARRRLDRAVRQGRGLILLTGPVGSGKTTVARALFESLEEEAFESRMLVVLRASADFKWLITRIA